MTRLQGGGLTCAYLSKQAACLFKHAAFLSKQKAFLSKSTVMFRITSGMFGMFKASLLKAGLLHRRQSTAIHCTLLLVYVCFSYVRVACLLGVWNHWKYSKP